MNDVTKSSISASKHTVDSPTNFVSALESREKQAKNGNETDSNLS